ncbi:MAG TPA: FmdB family zinc ribbon protein [Actinomycetota bacterium]
MPIYGYRCAACGHELEELQPMGADPPGPCPACGGDLRRTYGRVGVVFAGWGFNANDRLLPGDRPRKDFRTLKERAERIREGD